MMFGKNLGAIETAQRIPKGSVGVEIGVWRGDSSALFLEHCEHLHLVDPWSVVAYEDSDEFGDYEAYLKRYSKLVGSENPADFQRYYDGVYESVRKRFERATIHRCTSHVFFSNFSGRADWFYIDGSHSFEGCLHDLESASKVATQFLFGDDYGNKQGVTRAVDTFVEYTGLQFEVFGNQYQITL